MDLSSFTTSATFYTWTFSHKSIHILCHGKFLAPLLGTIAKPRIFRSFLLFSYPISVFPLFFLLLKNYLHGSFLSVSYNSTVAQINDLSDLSRSLYSSVNSISTLSSLTPMADDNESQNGENMLQRLRPYVSVLLRNKQLHPLTFASHHTLEHSIV